MNTPMSLNTSTLERLDALIAGASPASADEAYRLHTYLKAELIARGFRDDGRFTELQYREAIAFARHNAALGHVASTCSDDRPSGQFVAAARHDYTVQGAGLPDSPFAAESFADASAKFLARVDQAFKAGHDDYLCATIMEDGRTVARISQNGKVWPVAAWHAGMTPYYSPYDPEDLPAMAAVPSTHQKRLGVK